MQTLGSEFSFSLNKVGSGQCGIGMYGLVCEILKGLCAKVSKSLTSLACFLSFGMESNIWF